MTLTISPQALRSVADSIKKLNYVPSSWQQQLAGFNDNVRKQLDEFLSRLVQEGGQPKLLAFVLEQLADQQDAIYRERNSWSFVWSGPEALHSKTADTFATMDQLIKDAKHTLLISTFNIGLSTEFRELMKSIAKRLEAGQLERVDLFFHPKQIENEISSTPAGDKRRVKIREWFFGKDGVEGDVWKWPGRPHVYVDKRLIMGSDNYCFHHAKVVVADAKTSGSVALVTSANFSEAAQRSNFEAGWLVRDTWRANQVSDHFKKMVMEKLFVEL